MALDPLATEDDLTARNIGIPDGVDVDAVLAAVSDAIRDAAGVPITLTTSTVAIPVYDCGQWLALPGAPLISVATVLVAGLAVTDFTKVGDELYRVCGWGDPPSEVTATYTHGYTDVPADIVDLVCSFASLSMSAAGDDYGFASRVQTEELGDYKVGYQKPAGNSGEGTKSPSPIDIPAGTRFRLRVRFNGGAAGVTKLGR